VGLFDGPQGQVHPAGYQDPVGRGVERIGHAAIIIGIAADDHDYVQPPQSRVFNHP